jgi:DNA-binding response OmpR family regulator/anti-sigma regulatory factor (Ser/Thr protein kinase)
LKLINEILALTKLEHKKIALVEKPLLLFPFLNKITSSFESYAEMNGVQLDLDYQLDETLKILTDAGKVETIINNFLSNALKFTPNKGEIQVKVSTDTNQVLIEVIDTGQGIEKEDLPYVFDRFFQSKNKEIANSNGLGIGLALSNEFAKVLGGKLSVQSETGKGSCFQLAFPLKRTMEEIEEKERIQGLEAEKIVMPIKENLKVSEEKTAAKTFKILLVEDNVDLQHYLQTILAPLAAVKIAANGQIAWELLMTGNTAKRAQKEAFFPDLILSDLMMPTMNGYELLKKVKSNDAFSHIPFLMLTARGGLDDKLTALRIGVDDYLTKPFEEEELVLRIQNLLKVVKSRVLINKEAEKAEDKATELIYTVADQEWLSNLEKVVLENFKYTNFAVDQLAKLLHISKRNLHYKIKKLTGKTPAQYIQEARLATARKLLESKSKKTVKEVMYEVGLKDSSHFSKNFKKRYGKSPSSFL